MLVETDVKISGEGGIVLRYQNQSNYYLLRMIRSPDFEGVQLICRVDVVESAVSQKSMTFSQDTFYKIKIIAKGNTFRAYVNSTLQIEAVNGTFESGLIGIASNYGATFEEYRVSNNYSEFISD